MKTKPNSAVEKDNTQNIELQLAFNFVQFTARNIFLTGRAGTGKTTFLHDLKKLSPKRMIVVAPTGVAAINAGGVTIHSFFQLPFGPKIPGMSTSESLKSHKVSTQKRNIIKSLDLLIIDEISMVRADLLDSIDEVLRKYKRSDEPFGGVQLLMIGDMQQLPPVVKDDEWNLLSKYYSTAFFFSSQALQKTNYVTITLQKVYRQRDEQFIEILNKIRDKQMDKQAMDLLNERYKPDFDAADENYIILTTHNAKAKTINDNKLSQLKTKTIKFKAETSGNFPEYIFPTDFKLELKKGAQVMFVKNDPGFDKTYYNGKIGTIIEISEDEIIVQCPDDADTINVTPIEWQNVKYAIDDKSKEITETIDGTFTQIPLKLAWAITIHKSQGLTFEHAIIDSESAFTHGQVYVALSRCRSLEGMVLSTPFSPNSLKGNKSIESFNKIVSENQPDLESLEVSKALFQHKLLNELFSFKNLQNSIKWFSDVLYSNKDSLQNDISPVLIEMKKEFYNNVIIVSEKFQNQIAYYLNKDNQVEQNKVLQERITKASLYFLNQIQHIILVKLEGFTIETDNKEIRKKVEKSHTNLHQETKYKIDCLQSCKNGFIVKDFLKDRAKASLESTTKKDYDKIRKIAVSKEINNPEFYNFLKDWRDTKATEQDISHYLILTLRSIRALSTYVPSNIEQLEMMPGFGKKKLESLGTELLELINNYTKEHKVNAIEFPDKPKSKKKPKTQSKQISFELWQKHKDIEKIALERDLAQSTIYGHLAPFIASGELSINEFVEKEKLNKIVTFLNENKELNLSEARQKLGEEYSYAELKLSQQHLIYLNDKTD